ncbi:GntR family transcriptional regulator, LSA1692 subfamily [Lactococcus garvieae]|jgi:GntR family transcriptional regulator|uniref:GntR family transcriptional regulator, LSA1692 subfamily n=1 Tax=Lactococcus garvieae TaxID=1363 RepID=UPI0009BDFB8E|nr:GntR family transcriptional regulator, LSA1692 subfamily [Lactococcus garvieae]QPS71981.1 GntR family transcriptional regulator [Lactococcus garvieae]
MNTEKNGSKAKFRAVSQEIEKRIDKGVYVSAQKLPSEYDLALEFGVSRLTVRKAMEDLINKQIVIKKKGKGAYVIEQPKIQSGGMGLKSFTEAAKAMGKVGQTRLLHFQKLEEVPEEVVQALYTVSDFVELKRLRLLDDEPMTLEKLYFSEQLIIGATEKELTGSLFSMIEKKVEIGYSHQEIEAILATEELAKLLEVKVNSPIFRVHSTAFSLDARPILYDISYYRADKYSFKNTLIRQH